jgi:large subunit ribosomal protein L23
MKMDVNDIIKAPVITEESTIQSSTKNQFTFKVNPRANKQQIRDAIEQIWDVKVLSVNTMNYLGKVRRRGRFVGRRTSWKKAVVTLREGDAIDLI